MESLEERDVDDLDDSEDDDEEEDCGILTSKDLAKSTPEVASNNDAQDSAEQLVETSTESLSEEE